MGKPGWKHHFNRFSQYAALFVFFGILLQAASLHQAFAILIFPFAALAIIHWLLFGRELGALWRVRQFKAVDVINHMLRHAILWIVGSVVIISIIALTSGGEPVNRKENTLIILGNVESALTHFKAECGYLPDKEVGLKALVDVQTTCASAKQPFLKEPSLQDAWGRPFIYDVNGTRARVTSLGRDGKPGGEFRDEDLVAEIKLCPVSQVQEFTRMAKEFKSLSDFRSFMNAYSGCSRADVDETVSESVSKLIDERWSELEQLDLATEQSLIPYVGETWEFRRSRKIRALAETQCPAQAQRLCARILEVIPQNPPQREE